MYFTYTGNHISSEAGSPSLEDIAWQLLHVCRYAGACKVNYTVGIHSMLVADLVPRRLEFQALLHDGTEACIGDIPKPFKSDAMRKVEDILMARIWESFGYAPLNEVDYKLIKKADIMALCAEADLIGPPGLVKDGITGGWYQHNDKVVNLLKDYLSKYKVHAWGIDEGDLAQWDFLARARSCLAAPTRVIDYPYSSNHVTAAST